MEQERALDVVYRRRLFECVEENQGAHLRELARRAMLPLGTTLYHLDRLETCGLVVARRDGRYKRYFAGNSLGIAEKEMLTAFRHAVSRRIAVALLELGAATQKQLRERIGVSRSTMSFDLNDLIARRIVLRERMLPESGYLLVDADLAARILERYGASLGDVGPLHVRVPLSGSQAVPALLGAPPPAAPVGGA